MTPRQFKAWRKALGFTQAGMGAVMGVSLRVVSNWEQGITQVSERAQETLQGLVLQRPGALLIWDGSGWPRGGIEARRPLWEWLERGEERATQGASQRHITRKPKKSWYDSDPQAGFYRKAQKGRY